MSKTRDFLKSNVEVANDQIINVVSLLHNTLSRLDNQSGTLQTRESNANLAQTKSAVTWQN